MITVGQAFTNKKYGTTAVVQNEYIPATETTSGMWEVRIWQGFRHVGDVCISGRDLLLDYEPLPMNGPNNGQISGARC